MATRDHPVFARLFAGLSPLLERAGLARVRARLLADLHGTVIEIGAGSGASFPHYPVAVERVLAVEPADFLRRRARRRAEIAAPEVSIVGAVAEQLPFADASLDGAVSALTWCSVDSPQASLAELARVLVDDAPLVFVEHVRASHPWTAKVQQMLDRRVWPAVAGGCHLARDTPSMLADAGFALDWHSPVGRRGPSAWSLAPHVWGVARRRPRAALTTSGGPRR
ncbi:MAG: methyltransferase domain-containing protein [Nitriliruptoraceae bacterium]